MRTSLRNALFLIALSLALAGSYIGASHAQWQRGGMSRSFNTYSPPSQPRYAPPRPMMPTQVMTPRAPQFNASSRGPTLQPGSTTGVRMARPLPLPLSIRQNSAIAQMPTYTKRITITGAPIVVSRTGAIYSIPQQGVFGTRIITTYRPIRTALIQKYGGGKIVILQQKLLRVASSSQINISRNAKELRLSPGVATSSGSSAIHISENWLRGSQGNMALFPRQIAIKMIGNYYKNFDAFRKDFWMKVSATPELSSQFTPSNQVLMSAGNAPLVPKEQRLGGQKTYILHHKTPINQGGGVYDVDNIVVVSPLFHKNTLEDAFHYGR